KLGHRGRRDQLALVGIKEKWPPLLALHLLAAHRDLMEFRDEKASEDRGVLLADRTLREPGEEDLAVVHYRTQVKPALRGAHNPAHRLRAQEPVKTGQYRADALPCRQGELVPEV